MWRHILFTLGFSRWYGNLHPARLLTVISRVISDIGNNEYHILYKIDRNILHMCIAGLFRPLAKYYPFHLQLDLCHLAKLNIRLILSCFDKRSFVRPETSDVFFFVNNFLFKELKHLIDNTGNDLLDINIRHWCTQHFKLYGLLLATKTYFSSFS